MEAPLPLDYGLPFSEFLATPLFECVRFDVDVTDSDAGM